MAGVKGMKWGTQKPRPVRKKNPKVSDHPLYPTWIGMNHRCHNKKNPGYKSYGGRGISVCREWRTGVPNAFMAFVEYMGPRPAGYSIDRINNDGSYEPGNVRWADDATQRANTRRSTFGTYQIRVVTFRLPETD